MRRLQFSRDDTAQIVFTSGTTAEPRGVVLTHGNILASVDPIEREFPKYRKSEWLFHPIRFLELLPLSHVFGQFMGMFIPALLGGTVHFQDSFKPSDIITTIKRERISVLVAVPRVVESLKNKLRDDMGSVYREKLDPRGERALPETLVALPQNPATLWMEVLGHYFRRRGA